MKRHRRVSFPLAAALVASLLAPPLAGAMTAPRTALSDGLSEDESDALGTLALAEAPLRDAILEASLHAGAIDAIAQIRDDSSAAFRERLEGVPRSKQKDVWELVRYPELVDELVLGGRPSPGAVDSILEPYPERIRDAGRKLALRDFELLNDIAQIREDAERATAEVLAPLPLEDQASFEALIERPDLMSALANEPALVDRLARLYREDPDRTRALLDRHHDARVEENEREVAEWREALDEDPEAREELLESAERFAEEEGYDSPRETVVERTEVHYYHHPYPYWYGPPYWRIGWNWYPYRSHWGFHVSFGSGLAVYSLPSPIFSYWHYRHPRHHDHYRHLHRRWARYGSGHHLHKSYRHRTHKFQPRSREYRAYKRSQRHRDTRRHKFRRDGRRGDVSRDQPRAHARRVDQRTSRPLDRRTERRTERRAEKRVDRRVDGRVDGGVDRRVQRRGDRRANPRASERNGQRFAEKRRKTHDKAKSLNRFARRTDRKAGREQERSLERRNREYRKDRKDRGANHKIRSKKSNQQKHKFARRTERGPRDESAANRRDAKKRPRSQKFSNRKRESKHQSASPRVSKPKSQNKKVQAKKSNGGRNGSQARQSGRGKGGQKRGGNRFARR